MGMKNLYEQEVFDHYNNPRNFGLLSTYDFVSPFYNPSCGDSVTICGVIKNDELASVTFEGKGCMLSLAMASMLTVFAQNKKVDEILNFDEELVEQLLKIQLGIKRIQCGMLSLQALQKGIKLHQGKL